jgi:hypothetical protein
MSRKSWVTREIFRGPATWITLACAFGLVFLAGSEFGRGRNTEAAMWLLIAAGDLGMAYYFRRSEGKRR